MSEVSNDSRKRSRETESKKWSEDEVQKVLYYMQVHRNIDKPTAQIYYRKLLEETQIKATWHSLKCKVRYLKNSWNKAEAWSNSTGAGIEDEDGATTVRDKIIKMCPYYDELSDVFAEKSVQAVNNLVDMDSSSVFTEMEFLDESDVLPPDFDEPQTSSENVSFVNKVKSTSQKRGLERLAVMETDRNEFRSRQFQLEEKKFEWSKKMEKKKLKVEIQKVEKEYEFKKMVELQAMEKEYELKKMELEQNERIRIHELNLKYQNNK